MKDRIIHAETLRKSGKTGPLQPAGCLHLFLSAISLGLALVGVKDRKDSVDLRLKRPAASDHCLAASTGNEVSDASVASTIFPFAKVTVTQRFPSRA